LHTSTAHAGIPAGCGGTPGVSPNADQSNRRSAGAAEAQPAAPGDKRSARHASIIREIVDEADMILRRLGR
jgi:hypothetical protein